MTYLVTGAGGFIGARFIESCNRKGIPVISVDGYDTFERKEHEGLDFGRMIPRDYLRNWLVENNPKIEAIIHLGACTDTTETDVDYITRVNSMYSQQLWEYATHNHIPFIYASSAATYGDGSSGYDDDESRLDVLEPLNPYGQSKHDFDQWAIDGDQYGFCPPTWVGFKFFNVYGYGERHKDRMSSMVLQAYDQIKETGKVKLFKSHKEDVPDGHQKRDFIYVQDIIDVLNWAVQGKCIKRGIYNLGTGRARTYLDLVNAVFAALGKEPNIEFIDTPEDIRGQYQYFTEANMDKFKERYTNLVFYTLEQGVNQYVKRLESPV